MNARVFVVSLAVALVPAADAAFAQYARRPGGRAPYARPDAPTPIWEYQIQKRGSDSGRFTGWFLDINRFAEAEDGVARNIMSSWNDTGSGTTWELRRAGTFNGLDGYYIQNRGRGKFHGWYLGIDEANQQVVLYDTVKPSSTKWYIRWVGWDDQYDLFQIVNMNLGDLYGWSLAMNPQAPARAGAAANIGALPPGDPNVNFTHFHLRRLVSEPPEEAVVSEYGVEAPVP